MNKLRVIVGVAISALFFFILVPAVVGWVALWIDMVLTPITSRLSMGAGASRILSATSGLIGLFWITWSYSYLLFVGRGSPVEAFGVALLPTRRLVTTGPYQYTRNPMVFGMLWILLALVFYLRSPSGVALVPILALLAGLYLRTFEEKGLECRFGEAYHQYRERVPLLIPRLRTGPKAEE